MYRLRLLGCPTIEGPGGDWIPLASRRHPLALLALLASAPGKAMARGKLVGLLWPDSAERTARNRLNTCVHQVRSELGEGVLRSSGDEIQYGCGALWCDLVELERAIAANEYTHAISLYRGPFLDGFQMAASTEFEQHIDAERERLAQLNCDALEALAIAAEGAGRPETAVAWWRRRAAEDRFDARVAQRLMQALQASGNRAEALRVARLHAQRLREEFDAPPDADVEALADSITQADPSPMVASRSSAARRTNKAGGMLEHHPIHAIAVLPFENMSGSAEADPFAAGLHDDLLTELSRNRSLTVIARTSVLRFRGANRPVQEIAKELGVGTLLEGAVQLSSDRLRLNVQLIDARSGGHRWAERYDRMLNAESLFDIQVDLAERIAASLRDALAPSLGVTEQHKRRQTGDLDAWRLHAQGQQNLLQLTHASVHRAVECFRRATVCDPDYAMAWAGLADALTTLDDYGYGSNGEALLAEAKAAASHAMTLAPDLAEAHASLGKLRGMHRQGPAAVRDLARAIELRPGYASAHNWLGWIHQCLGRGTLALENAKRAVELDPLSPEAVSNLAVCLLANGQEEDALRETCVLREIAPDWPTSAFCEALVFFRLQRYDEVCAVVHGLSVPWVGNGPRCLLALACIGNGQHAQALDLQSSFEREGDHFSAGLVQACQGDVGAAHRSFGQVADWGAYWPTLATHHYFPDLWAQMRPQAAFALAQVNLAWGLDADGHLDAE